MASSVETKARTQRGRRRIRLALPCVLTASTARHSIHREPRARKAERRKLRCQLIEIRYVADRADAHLVEEGFVTRRRRDEGAREAGGAQASDRALRIVLLCERTCLDVERRRRCLCNSGQIVRLAGLESTHFDQRSAL